MTNRQIVEAWFSHIDTNNFDAVKNLMDARHSFKNPMSPEPANAEEHIGMMQMMTGAFSGQHHFDQLVEQGEWIAVSGHWEGTHTGEFNGVPATGKRVTF